MLPLSSSFSSYQLPDAQFAPPPQPMFPGMDFAPSSMQPVPQYAKGGRVQGLRQLIEHVRQAGEGEDKILAHINPEEACALSQQYGGDINPHTGLPQFGLFKKLGKAVGKVFGGGGGGIGKILGPVLGTAVGTMFGGPLGGMLGGGLGGAVSNKNPLQGALLGGAMGGGYHALGPHLGLPGASGPGIGSLFSNATKAATNGSSFFGGGNLLNAALLSTAIAGAVGRKEKQQGPKSMDEAWQMAQPRWRDDQQPRKHIPQFGRMMRQRPQNYQPGIDPEQPMFDYVGDGNPWAEQGFKEGGYLDGNDLGQADTISARLSDGEFVIPADVVADLGDGNNQAGAKQLYGLIDAIRAHKGKNKGLPPQAKPLSHYLKER